MKTFEDHQFISAPHIYPMELVDVDIKQVVADVVAENPDIEVEYADVTIHLLTVSVAGQERQWMSLSTKRIKILSRYFYRLADLMPGLKVEVSLARLEGKNAQLVYKDMEKDTVYSD